MSNGLPAGQSYGLRLEAAGCKTVGSAYVGSNLTPATTSENGSLAAHMRAGAGGSLSTTLGLALVVPKMPLMIMVATSEKVATIAIRHNQVLRPLLM